MEVLDLDEIYLEKEQWKSIIYSVVKNQGKNLKEIRICKSNLNSENVESLIQGFALGCRSLLEK
jgi:hypothetical protein